MSHYDVVLIGGGPAGLAAALTLGRALKRVLLLDSGTPRNERATHIYNFVTRDGTPPNEFRTLGREQLSKYSTVEIRDEFVTSIAGEKDQFLVRLRTGEVQAKRIILCTGMVDEMIAMPGFKEAWGHSIYQCPYCHGWEVRDRRWGLLVHDLQLLEHGFPALLQSWTDDVVVFTHTELEIPDRILQSLEQRGIRYETRRVAKLIVDGHKLTHIELIDGEQVACEVLFAHPSQRQVDVVKNLNLELENGGYVKVDPMTRQTSIPGIYAAGDLTTRAQGAVFAASTGTHAAGMVNHNLSMS